MNDLITQHLDLWTTAIASKATTGRGSSDKQTAYGIKKLRELILELAVRGKLVPQDSNDEPASILLSKILTEQKSANTKRKAKNSSELTQNPDYEKPFALPTGWVWISLEAIGNIFNGNSVNSSIKQSKYTNLDSGLPFIATKDVGYGWDGLDYGNGVLIPLNEMGFRVAHKNAVLVCAEGGSAGKKCGITKQDICFGNKLFAIELYGEIEPNYILANYLTPTFFQQFTAKMTGIIGGISSASFSQLMIPLPPLAEQHRIVAKVDELMALCDQLEQQQTDSIAAHQTLVQTLLDTLTQAVDAAEFEQAWNRIADHFDTLFTTESSIDQLKQTLLQLAVTGKLVQQDPADEPASILLARVSSEKESVRKHNNLKLEKPLPKIPENQIPYLIPRTWQWTRIGTIALSTDYGLSEKTFDDPSGIPVLKMGDIIDGRVVLGGQKTVAINTEGLANLLLEKGDLLYNRTNSAELVGKTGLYDGDDGAYSFASYLIRIRTLKQLVLPRFLNICMNSRMFRSTQIEPHLKQQCGQANVNGTIMRNMMVPIPPVEEQHRIVAKVDELMALCDALKARLAAAQTTQLQLADAIVEQAVA
jgi:type I restriction enzyme S subunit